jgi:hypothetical protein
MSKALVLPNSYVSIDAEEMMYIEGGSFLKNLGNSIMNGTQKVLLLGAQAIVPALNVITANVAYTATAAALAVLETYNINIDIPPITIKMT